MKQEDYGKTILFTKLPLTSGYPSNFIPKGSKVIIGVDLAKDGMECTVKGFCKDGEYHIQKVEYSK